MKSKIFWLFFDPAYKFVNYIHSFKEYFEKRDKVSYVKIESVFSELKVMNGPFKGLKYGSLSSYGSAIYPKLLGSYERELHAVIEKCCQDQYSEIIDVGCAEGYYAVGLAIRNKSAKVYAYDTESEARKLCEASARLNSVSQRVNVHGFFSPDELAKFKFTGKGLVICDCEGYEKILFNNKNIQNLSNCDLVIELHDFMDPDISHELLELFSKTHKVEKIKSLDDLEKTRTYAIPEISELNFYEKLEVLREYRPFIMDWYYCTPLKG